MQTCYKTEGLTIAVNILGTRTIFGRTEVLISPVSGSGQKWVLSKKVSVKNI